LAFCGCASGAGTTVAPVWCVEEGGGGFKGMEGSEIWEVGMDRQHDAPIPRRPPPPAGGAPAREGEGEATGCRAFLTLFSGEGLRVCLQFPPVGSSGGRVR